MVRVKIVGMERNTRGGDNDIVFCSGEDDVVEDSEVFIRIVTRMSPKTSQDKGSLP